MAIVSVETELLSSGGESITNYKDDNELHYNNVTLQSINSCPSFESFKSALSDKFSTYSNHCDIAASRIEECANALIEIDAQIAGDSEATSEISETTNEDISEFTSLSGLTAITSINLVVDIESLISLSDSERKQVFNDLSSSLTNAVSSIENGNGSYESNSEYELVNKLVDNFMDNISTTNSDGTVTYKVNDLVKNDFYNEVVKEYGESANIKITPDMLHYASRNGMPLIRSNNNLTITESHNTTNIGEEYNFYKMGTAYMDETSSPYSSELYESTGSYERKYSYYPDGMTGTHFNSKNWYICDDGFYRDADGYIVCADRYNMGYNENGSERNVHQIIEDGSDKAIIVDTPFGPGKVYDWCEQGNIDIYVHR